MFRIKNLLFKAYAFIFAWSCLGNIVRLLLPQSEAYIYYHIMKAFFEPARMAYFLSLTSATINLLCLFPLFMIAFNDKRPWQGTFKFLFYARIISDILGHNYELQFLKSSFFANPLLGWVVTLSFLGFLVPSYAAHFRYAFGTKTN